MIILEAMYTSARFYYIVSFQFMYSGIVYCGMQAKSKCICTYDEIKVGLLQYNNAGYLV